MSQSENKYEAPMRLARGVVGTVLAAAGFAAIIFGGFVAAGVTDGQHPHELLGMAPILGGLALIWIGLWIAGVDLT